MSTKETTSPTRTLGVALGAMAVMLVVFLMSDSESVRWIGSGVMVVGIVACVTLLGKAQRSERHATS